MSPAANDAAAFVRDIAAVLADPAAAARTAAENVALIGQKYSLAPMAIDMEKIYLRQLRNS
jgi:hypothetical protein